MSDEAGQEALLEALLGSDHARDATV